MAVESGAESSAVMGSMPAAGRRALAIVNAEKESHPSLDPALKRLAAEGIALRHVQPPRGDPDWDDFAGIARDASMIIVGGGDGTMNRFAPLILKTGLPLGILPLGTANDLARTLHLPSDPVAAASVIAAGRTRTIDVGEVNGRPYFNVASMGMTVDVASSLTSDLKRRWGKAAYLVTSARLLFAARPFSAVIGGGGKAVRVRTLQIAVGNGRYYGGGLAVDEAAAIDDQHLHLYSLEMMRAWHMLPMLWAFRRGTHGRRASVRTLVGDRFEVRTRRPRPVNADGEIITSTPATFRVLPRAVRVFVP